MNHDEHESDRVWELLRKADSSPSLVPESFARKLADQARTTPQDARAIRPIARRLLHPVFFLVPAAAAAALALFIGLPPSSQPGPETVAVTRSPVGAATAGTETAESTAPAADPVLTLDGFASDLEEIDTLLAIQDVQSLDDDAIGDLLF